MGQVKGMAEWCVAHGGYRGASRQGLGEWICAAHRLASFSVLHAPYVGLAPFVPGWLAEPLGRELSSKLTGPVGTGFLGLPGVDETLTDFLSRHGQVDHERMMLAPLAIVGLAGRHRQAGVDQVQREVVKQRTVIQKVLPFAAHTVARKLHPRASGRSSLATRRRHKRRKARPVCQAQTDGLVKHAQGGTSLIAEHQAYIRQPGPVTIDSPPLERRRTGIPRWRQASR